MSKNTQPKSENQENLKVSYHFADNVVIQASSYPEALKIYEQMKAEAESQNDQKSNNE
jgi:hypothetical protein